MDECSDNPCAAGAECVNTAGGYTCKCPIGYTGTGKDEDCIDVNECGKQNSCGVNAKCINLPGSYKCICPQGFSGQGEIFCES